MRFNKKIVLLIAIVSLLFTVLTIQDTYAKYTSSVSSSTNISIARWKILVNSFDIKNELTTGSLITPVFEGSSYIAGDVIAPTATGYFDVVIDSTETDVAFTYTMSISNAQDSLVTDLEIDRCLLNGSQVPLTNGQITGSIRLTDNQTNTIRVYIRWKDGSGETMNNAADTATTKNANPVAKVNVTLNFTQLAN